jgi:hypothetical protein
MIEKTFSKIEVACQQLDTAIKLWFQEENPVSIHTLVCSAHQIISDVIHHQNRNDPLFDNIYIKNGFKKIAKTHFHKYYNFFKHANNDPETSIKFNPSANEYFIVCSIFGLEQLNIKHNLLHRTFMTYFAIHHPRLLTDECLNLFFHSIPPEHFAKIRRWTRQEFFDEFSETFPYLAR